MDIKNIRRGDEVLISAVVRGVSYPPHKREPEIHVRIAGKSYRDFYVEPSEVTKHIPAKMKVGERVMMQNSTAIFKVIGIDEEDGTMWIKNTKGNGRFVVNPQLLSRA